MESLDINNIKPILSGPIALMNYMNDLKYNEKLDKIKQKLEITRELHSIEFARKLKEYKLICDVKGLEYRDLKKEDFPFIACCKKKSEEMFFIIYDVNDDGVVTKDENKEEKLIGVIDFKEIFNERIIVIKDNKEFIRKYSYSRELHRAEIIGGIGIISLAVAGAILELLDDVKFKKNPSKPAIYLALGALALIGILFIVYLIFNAIYDRKKRKFDTKILELEIENTDFHYDTRRKNK